MYADAVVVGAGVVGLACAERLSRRGLDVVVVEAHEGFGRETSSRNSEVIHSGIYYPTGSLKAELCLEGSRLLYAWCAERGVEHLSIGKYIVATREEEEADLDRLIRQAHANGAVEVERVDAARVRRAEPNLRATAALWCPRTGIVDSHGFMQSLLSAAKDRGCIFAWKHRVLAAAQVSGGYEISIVAPSGEVASLKVKSFINAAGLRSDEVARMGGIDIDAVGYRLTYVKGSYFRVARRNLVQHLIYPVPPAGLAGLGLHVTVDLAGVARVGPDVEVQQNRRMWYDVDETRRGRFLEAVSRYLPCVVEDDLVPDQSGIRPKLGVPGGAIRDFVICEESSRGLPRWVNLIGIESPGLTASLAIARMVSDLLGA